MEAGLLWTVVGVLSIPVLVVINGFFVAAEFALVAVRRTRVEELINQGVKGARSVDYALRHLDRSIAASQLGITVASILLGMVAEPVLVNLVQPLFHFLPEDYQGATAHTAAGILALLIVTILHVIFGEVMPKSMALQVPDASCLWVAKPLNVFARLTRPLVWIINGTANVLLKRMGFEPASGDEEVHSLEELSLLIEDTEEAGLIGPDQADFVQNVFRLSNRRVRDCMVPREKMACLELNTPPEQALEAVRAGAHTRMPVYEGDADNIIGIVNTKDLFYLFSLSGVIVLADALYPATYLDPEETVANALRLFRKSHRPMALVRDEAGRIHGLLTLEDVLEEIVGDIEDEHDTDVPRLKLASLRRRRARIAATRPASTSQVALPPVPPVAPPPAPPAAG